MGIRQDCCGNLSQLAFLEARASVPSIDSCGLGRFKMRLRILVLFVFLGGTLAMKIGIGESQNLHLELKTCLATVIEKVCPDCITGHIVVPSESTWEANALVSHFSDSLLIHAMTIYDLDHPGHEDPLDDQVGLYLVNSEVDLTMVLKHLRETNSKRDCVIWVNFYFGRSLSNYLKSTTPATWNLGKGWSIIFVGLKEGEVQVFGTPIQKSRSSNAQSFRNLSVCDTKALIEVSQPLEKIIEARERIIMVTARPHLLPYIERFTDNPGGYIGRLMDVLKARLHFTPKYVWSTRADELQNFTRGNGPRMAFNLYASHKKVSLLASSILMVEGVWMIATPNSNSRGNVLALPFKNGIFLHITLLVIYTSVMVCLSRELDKTRIMLRLFGMFFGIGVSWLPKKSLYRYLVVMWCFASYILLQAYLAVLTSELSAPIINKPYRDTDDLMKSGIEMFCNKNIKQLYCNLKKTSSVYICEECVVLTNDSLWHIRPNGFSMNKPWRSFAVTIDTQVIKAYFRNKSFTTMQERIGMWPAGVSTNMDMKFLQKISNISERLLEAGILQHWLTQYEMKNTDDSALEHEMLNMSHLNDVFIVLYVGWSWSMVVFVIEILTKRYLNN